MHLDVASMNLTSPGEEGPEVPPTARIRSGCGEMALPGEADPHLAVFGPETRGSRS